MPSKKVARASLLVNAFHVISAVGILAVFVLVRAFDKPGWLIAISAALPLMSVGLQLLFFKFENDNETCPRCSSAMDYRMGQRAPDGSRLGPLFTCRSCGRRFRRTGRQLVDELQS